MAVTLLITVLGYELVTLVHMAGHVVVAKIFGTRVERVSFGFGRAMWSWLFRRGETTYQIALFPLGGYVKLAREDCQDPDKGRDLIQNQPLWRSLPVLSAGVLANLVFACTLFGLVALRVGETDTPAVIGTIDAGSPLWIKGVHSGDIIHQIGNRSSDLTYSSLMDELKNARPGEALNFVFGPPDGSEAELVHTTIVPRSGPDWLRPTIGMGMPHQLKFVGWNKSRDVPVKEGSAAKCTAPHFLFYFAIAAIYYAVRIYEKSNSI